MVSQIKDFIHFFYNVQGLIEWGGLTLVCAIVFAETGLFFGFFLPGDSLLVSAGVFARTGHISLGWLLILGCIAAVTGDQVGYAIGYRAGQTLFQKEDSLLFKRKHLLRTHEFYEKYGNKTIVIARFVPIVRTFAPVVAGIAAMRYKRFVSYNIIGGVAWVCGMALAGYCLASLIPHVEKRIHLVILFVIFISILPGIIEFYREHKKAGLISA